MGTVIEDLQVKYWQRVPSVGSRPQYFSWAQIFVFPWTQNSHLVDRSVLAAVYCHVHDYSLHAGKARLDCDSLAHGAVLDIASDLDNDTRGLVAQDQLMGELVTFPIVAVRAADTGGNYFDEHLIFLRRDNWALLDLELPGPDPDNCSV